MKKICLRSSFFTGICLLFIPQYLSFEYAFQLINGRLQIRAYALGPQYVFCQAQGRLRIEYGALPMVFCGLCNLYEQYLLPFLLLVAFYETGNRLEFLRSEEHTS